MISIGAKVRIIGRTDETAPKWTGLYGIVTRRETGSGPWPVGESPEDPLYVVKTSKGDDAFWAEELRRLEG